MPRVNAKSARAIAIYLVGIGFTIRDVAEVLSAHERAVAALIASVSPAWQTPTTRTLHTRPQNTVTCVDRQLEPRLRTP